MLYLPNYTECAILSRKKTGRCPAGASPEMNMNQAESKKDIKKNNRSRVFQYLMNQEGSTRRAMMQALNLSMPTLVRNINELSRSGLIVATGQDDSSGGRRPETFSINYASRVAIGIDVTRRHVAFIAVDLGVNILAHKREFFPVENTPAYFKRLGEIAADFIADLNCADQDVLGIGISVPGILSQDRSRLLYGDVIDFNGGDTARFTEVLKYPCWFSNDSSAAGFAEFLSMPNLKDAIYLYLSNSVGGSIMIDGRMFEGAHNKSAEFGHLNIVKDGRQCYCGLRGCFNAYCNATLLAEAVGGSVEDFFTTLAAGDAHCREVWEEYKGHLVQTIRMLRTIFDTDVIIGGYVGSCMGPFFEEVRQQLFRDQLFEHNESYIHPCKYKVEAAALGAALHYIQAFIYSI